MCVRSFRRRDVATRGCAQGRIKRTREVLINCKCAGRTADVAGSRWETGQVKGPVSGDGKNTLSARNGGAEGDK